MNEILKCLEKILQLGYSSFNIFSDWLDLMLYALQTDDDNYLKIVQRYRNDKAKGEREIDYFCQAFALLQIEMQKTNDDILGQVYINWNMSNTLRGQFFTPKHVASMMAQCLNPKGRILDPCCGSGVMLVEAIKTIKTDVLREALFFGQDIDITCVKMCALNLTFFNVNGFVVWGDSLLLECKQVYQTSRSQLGGSIRELNDEDLDKFRQVYVPALDNINTPRDTEMSSEQTNKLSAVSEQLSIF